MPTTNTVAAPRSILGDFFGSVTEGIGQGISRITSEILPNWTASQLGLQSTDQLERNMFDPEGRPAPIKVDGSLEYAEIQPQKALFDLGQVNVTGSGLVIAGLVFIGTLLVLKKVL